MRYSGSSITQRIQSDDQDEPLYTSKGYIKYLTEYRNLDICVADRGANAVVFVSAVGKFRFRYTGSPSTSRNLLLHAVSPQTAMRTSWHLMVSVSTYLIRTDISSATSTTAVCRFHGVYAWITKTTSLWLSGSKVKQRNSSTTNKETTNCVLKIYILMCIKLQSYLIFLENAFMRYSLANLFCT